MSWATAESDDTASCDAVQFRVVAHFFSTAELSEVVCQVFLCGVRIGPVEEWSQGRMAESKRAFIARAVIRRAIVPTAPKDADPLKGEGADGDVMRFPMLPLLAIERPRPRAVKDGMMSKLVKGLPEKGRRGPPPMDLALSATTDRDRGNAGVRLHGRGRGKASAIGAECDEETWSEGVPGPREAREEGRVGMAGKGLRDRRFQLLDTRGEGEELPAEELDIESTARDHGGVAGEGEGRGHLG